MNLFLHTFWWNGVGLSHKELRLMMRLFYFAHIMVECWPIVVWDATWRTQTYDGFFFPRSQWISCDLLVPKFLVQENNISKAAAASLQDQIWLGLWNATVVFHSLKTDQFVCCLQVDPDTMKESLAHYFIYTGHNSYLTGNQLNSKCSVEPIKAALKQGVRAIELDVWPNAAKDDIQVLHGKYVALFPCEPD